MMNEEQHISEVMEELKPQLTQFSKFYNNLSLQELPYFFTKDREIQRSMLADLYEKNSELEQLLRTIIDEDLNAKTIQK